MNALDIRTGEELEHFDMGEIEIYERRYTALTGYENTERRCWWCGGELKGKALHYCRGHMKLYYNNFNWQYAAFEARKRAGDRCENCGASEGTIGDRGAGTLMTNLRVHHIVPLKGESRFFSAFNLPWNLVVLCHACHLEVHVAMRPPAKTSPTSYEIQIAKGQLPMVLA
jgi:hypothetical protein